MKKFLSTILATVAAFSPVAALAAPSDATSTSNFTFTVVEPTIGLNIYGDTQLSDVVSKYKIGGNQVLYSGAIGIENSGNIAGKLFLTVQPMSGIDFGSNPEQLNDIQLYKSDMSYSGQPYNNVGEEYALETFLPRLDTDNDPSNLGPQERLQDVLIGFKAVERFPVGDITIPIQWTLKPN